MDSLPEPLPPKISEVINSTFDLIPPGVSLSDFNSRFLSEHKNSAPHIIAGLRTRQRIDPTTQSQNEKELCSIVDVEGVTIKDAEEALALLREWKSEAAVKELLGLARKKWEQASAFQDR